MDFEKMLRNYAKLIVHHGANVQKDQMVQINGEPYHRNLVLLLAEEAYDLGAKYVDINYGEPYNKRLRIQKSSLETLKFVPAYLSAKYRELVDVGAANISIVGEEEPDLLVGLDTKKINTSRIAQYHALKYFYDEGIDKSRVHWIVAAAATPKWAAKIFKDKTPQEAERLLWLEIFKICRVDQADFLQIWQKHNRVLEERARRLTELKIKTLHFTGPGTDLRIGLSNKALFRGGSEKSTRGVQFEPNIPTEECFTTPDWRRTEGRVHTTRPFLINGVLIKGLKLEFKQGEIASFSCEAGQETFSEYIASDPGAKRLGEVALVGIDSPIYQSGLIFEEILYDENAACHIAVGSAYNFCLRDSTKLSKEALAELGCNDSSVHTDMMISSSEVDVSAHTYDGQEICLIKGGGWL